MLCRKSKDEYTYTKIGKLESGLSRVNLYGVLDEVVKELSLMTTGKYNGRIKIRDETCAPGKSLLIHFFIPSCVNFPSLEKGCIIRLHRVKLETFNDVLDGRIFSANDLAVFPREPDPGDAIYSTAASVQFTANDKVRLVELRRWISSWWDAPTLAVTPSNSTSPDKNNGVECGPAESTAKLTSPDKNVGIHNGGGNTSKPTLRSKEKKLKEEGHQKNEEIIIIDISPKKGVKELPKKPENNILIPKRELCTQKRKNPFFNSSKSKQKLQTLNLVEETYKTCSESDKASPKKIDPLSERMCANGPKSASTDSGSALEQRLIVLLERCCPQPSPKRLKTSPTKDTCVPVQDNQVNGLMESKAESQVVNTVPEYSNFSFFEDPDCETSACSDEDRERSMQPPGCSSSSAPLSSSHASGKEKKPPNVLGNLAEKNSRDDQSECPGQVCACETCGSESRSGSGPVFTDMEEDDGNDPDETLLEEPIREEKSNKFQYLPFQWNVDAKRANLQMFENFSWPMYHVHIQIIQMKPTIHALKCDQKKDLMSGFCKMCGRSTMYSQLRWKQSKPGYKMALCPYCMEAGVRLDFKFKFIVKDAWGTTLKMVATGKDASEFLGCTVCEYQSNPVIREATVKNLEALKCGRFFKISVRKIFTQVESQYHICQTSLESLLQS